jgi:predicted acyl esterase
MVPYRQEFAKINIPVLTITGYYDDGQPSALDYMKQHTTYNRKADHYLVIGPYDHFGTHAAVKPAILRDYSIDPAAQLDSVELKLQWMDWILQGGPKPAILADKVNYEVMGANEWRHVPSVEKMHPRSQRLWFTNVSAADRYRLEARKPASPAFLEQTVDLANRRIYNNYNAYPSPIILDSFRFITEMMFISEPFEKPTVVAGPFSGELNITINKKDVDLGVTVFEVMPDGKFFHLGYWTGRASYARDGTHRVLMTPDRPARIPFATSFTGRRLSAGSRLLVFLDVNKNPGAQVNYGTGKDVSDESIADAGEPLRVKWHNDSYMDVPLSD